MSPKAAAEFGKQWPDLQRRLRYFLRSRNVPASEIDDLVQEVAARLVSFWPKIDSDRPIWPLTATIALNLLRDRSRRHDAELPGELPDCAGHSDVADAGIARLELAAVIRAMESLSASQRNALLQVLHPESDSPSTPAEKMLRMRARRRLANAVGRVGAGLAFKVRRLSDNLHGFFSKAEGVTQALACTTCLLVASAGGMTFDSPLVVPAPAGEVSPSVVAGAAATKAAMPGAARAANEDLGPSRVASADIATTRTAGTRQATAKSKRPASSTEAVKTHPGLTVPNPPSLPEGDAPIPAPEPPGTPDQPVEPPSVDAPTPYSPPQPPQSDAPVPVVEEVTNLLKKKTPR
jgi:hypothetical protein